MQLQEQVSRKLGTKKYIKYTIVIPQKDIEALKWKKGDGLTSHIENGKLVITRKTKATKQTG